MIGLRIDANQFQDNLIPLTLLINSRRVKTFIFKNKLAGIIEGLLGRTDSQPRRTKPDIKQMWVITQYSDRREPLE
ncbi:hypothetical protein [Brunnivagina elsteri]|uniref:Uncharacterized protein n=1 Tax=Brunnivagina elsteri CCALA 953 TaxID=987040 RepID=A0A2A2TD06_9CYAN|nr:hypothetical protein [Calothrix elsteri]PAX51612.1 hypothetical protein CK510_23880 [Calothrix elsteri CCALA 953]